MLSYNVRASNILVWNPPYGASHLNFLGNIADILTAEGHNVTIYSNKLDPHVDTFGNRRPAHTVRFDPKNIKYNSPINPLKTVWVDPPCNEMCLDWDDISQIINRLYEICAALLEHQDVIKNLQESNFDLVFSETYDACAPGIWKLIGIKNVILVSALGMMPRLYDLAGMYSIPSFMPGALTPFSDEMTFIERLTNFNLELTCHYFLHKTENRFLNLFLSKYPDFPTIDEIYKEKTALIMVNANEFAETARPTTGMIKYIGGSAISDPILLSEDLNQLLEQNPVNILFSMGSVVQLKDMPEWLKRDIIETFASFYNVTFIWKYEGDDLYGDVNAHPNIHLMNWIPQIDLLADPRVSAFITHGGINSVLEAMYFGKPMIVVPLSADEQYNSKNIERKGLGILIKKHLLNKKTLTDALQHIMQNKKIAHKAALVSSLLEGRPKQYRRDIVSWAEIIIEHGHLDYLKLHSRHLNWVQYHCLDVIAFELCLIISVIIFVIWTAWKVYCLVGLNRLFKVKRH